MNHDPKEFIRGIQQIVISDTKRIGFLAGAGTSIAIKNDASELSKVPGVKEMTERIIRLVTDDKQKRALEEIKEELTDKGIPFLIEYILTDIAQKESVIGKNLLCGLSKSELSTLRLFIEEEIRKMASVHLKEKDFVADLLHCDFAEWISHASRKIPIEIFTTNYDYLFEIGLEHHNIPYFDGFIGGYKPFFDPASVEDLKLLPQWTKLWKLHGSLGWDKDHDTNKIFRTDKNASKIIIYPSILKYDNSRKQPYLSFMDRLSNFIKADDGVIFVCGYSFGDMHINDTIFNALDQTSSSHVIAFLFDDFNDNSAIANIAKERPNLSIYGKRNAVIGGKFGEWRLKAISTEEDSIQIDSYFNKDAAEPDKAWTGQGDFKLVDFAKFVTFLKTVHYENFRLGLAAK